MIITALISGAVSLKKIKKLLQELPNGLYW
jgi:hypothetical protein